MSDIDFRLVGKAGRERIARFDAMTYEEVVEELGQPDCLQTEFYESPWWTPGQGRPALATEDVAAIQAMGRCLTWRHRGQILPAQLLGLHPGLCGWCDYPEQELREAVGWASYMSRYVAVDAATWEGKYGSHYDRDTPRQGHYANPVWEEWFGNEPDRKTANERRRGEIAVAAYPPEAES